MSTRAASISHSVPSSSATVAASGAPDASKALVIGAIGIALTAAGFFVSGGAKVAFSWLVGMTFWTGIALGMLFLIMIHHIFDASWSVLLRRQFEHGVSAFKWLALLFVPLLASIYLYPGSVWKWRSRGWWA